MRGTALHIVRFFIIILAQGLLFGQLELSWGIHIMIYPLYILLLPFEIGAIWLLLIGFATGISVDFFMNTFGLHASAGLLVAYMRPQLYRLFAPRDGYDILKEPTINSYGFKWFISVAGITTVVHHLWFFTLELFQFTAFLFVLQKTVLSAFFSILLMLFIQVFFFKKENVL